MPIYEYQCHGCGQITEELQKMSDPPLGRCPACGGQVSKLMSMNSFHLKGTGWYVTDYARKNSNSSSSTTGSTESKADKAENKPASTDGGPKADASSSKSD